MKLWAELYAGSDDAPAEGGLTWLRARRESK
jgi:hypothetical protein